MSDTLSTRSERAFTPDAAVLAWLWPGLGHIRLGERRRGLLIMFGVLFLFLGGVLVGGVDCVDRRHDGLWFLAQGLCGPIAFAADFANQSLLKTGRVGEILTHNPPMNIHKTIGKVNEMGTLFTALAGLMNLVVILDALRTPRREPARRLSDRTDATAA